MIVVVLDVRWGVRRLELLRHVGPLLLLGHLQLLLERVDLVVAVVGGLVRVVLDVRRREVQHLVIRPRHVEPRERDLDRHWLGRHVALAFLLDEDEQLEALMLSYSLVPSAGAHARSTATLFDDGADDNAQVVQDVRQVAIAVLANKRRRIQARSTETKENNV